MSLRSPGALTLVMRLAAHPLGVGLTVAGLVAAVALGGWQFLGPPLGWALLGVAGAALQRDRLPGRVVRPSDEPELTRLVTEVADAVGFSAPLSLRVVPTVDAALVPSKVRGARVFGLVLGWPLLRFLTRAELAAVVAHELAHEQHTADRRTSRLLAARADLAESTERTVRLPSRWVLPLLAAGRRTSWEVELAADADAAGLVGAAAVAAALRRTEDLTAGTDATVAEWLDALADRGQRPLDLYDAFAEAAADPVVAARVAALQALPGEHPTDSHPPLAARLAALGPVDPAPIDAAPLALRTAAELEAWCTESLADPDAEPVRVLDLPVADLVPPLGDAVEGLQHATTTRSRRAAVDACLDAVEQGRWQEQAGRLVPSEAGEGPATSALASCLAGALADQLLEGDLRVASRWTNTALAGPDGEVVDLWLLSLQALATGETTALRALAAR